MAVRRGINNNNLKQENRGLVLKMIATGSCCTRVDLAKKTGLSKMSVSNIIGEFMEQHIVVEEEAQKVCGQGRNPIHLALTKDAPKVVGLDIHRSECVAVLSDIQLNVLKMERCELNQENSRQLYDIIFRLLDTVMMGTDKSNILGIGVGGSGPVDIKKGMILNSPDFYGLRDLEITSLLKEHYDLPVYMDSQYNCAALAEKYFGVGKQYRDFVFLGIMRGIGSGIIADEKILRNANGFTSEIGHISIDWKGKKCVCGNHGCLESYAGSEVIRERMKEATGLDYSFREFCRLAETKCNKESIRDEKNGENPAGSEEDTFGKINAIFEDMIEKLACGMTSTVNMLNLDAVIIGHEGYFIPDIYIDKLEREINRHKLSGEYRHVAVLKSYFKDQAHIIGCACPVLDKAFGGKLKI
ncbi:MAG: ROK family transcriptional regulator [Clostridia bacterium]|nr:ROK family transcriptional regulator [Clostridia bacterium]